MPILYDLAFLIIAIIYLPVYLFRGKFHGGFFSRLGILPKDLELNRPIWVHAVSVGEALAVSRLIAAIRENFPGKRLVISSITPTGNKVIRGFAQGNDFVTYLPLDFSFITDKVIARLNPSLVVIAETELWPNFILSLSKRKIPVLVVNGRISDRSFRGYLKIKSLLKPVLDKVSLFCMQAGRDAERLKSMGAAEGKIRITGNMKFDAAGSAAEAGRAGVADSPLRQRLGLAVEEKFFVAGSTHPGEEEIILNVYKSLLGRFSRLRLLVAPRHPQRAAEAVKLVIRYGFSAFRISQLGTGSIPAGGTVFVLDSIGQLNSFYAISDIVFVGGSLVKKGGHNILEPAFFAKPIICGPYMFNFPDIADLFVSNNACISVNNPRQLESEIAGLLDNPQRIDDLGRKARELISQNSGAMLRNLECIKELLKC